MRTTLNLPEELVDEAMQVTGSPTKTALIIHLLKEAIRKNRIADIKKYKGSVDLEVDLNALRQRAK